MPIEFACPECDSFLRTADEKAGLRIRCPVCQEPAWVPDRSEQGSFTAPETEGDSGEPSAWPTLQEQHPFGAPSPEVDFPAPGAVSVAAILRHTWEVYTRNFSRCLMAAAVDLLATAGAFLAALVMGGITFVVMESHHELALLAAMVVFLIGMTVTYSAITVGNFRYYLAMARDNPLSAHGLVLKHGAIGRLIVAWILFWTLAFLGLLMFVLPGLIAMILLWPFAAIIVDRNTPAARALQDAFWMTTRNPGVAASVCLLHLVLLVIAGTLPVVGQIVALPLAALLHSVSYLHLSGQVPSGVDPSPVAG
ncbi:hypothetical protein SH661x_001882 [Planctomicrobium sp. SH661]|uniref:hypothetical protein n=1 Tax=Planctomicrobium sp. SH661 TaxID=3448124 RepID=UPI003F5C1035